MRRAGASVVIFTALLCGSPAAAQQYFQQGPKLVGTGAVGAAQQGSSAAISADGNTAIVGGPFDNGNTGAVWVFTRNGTVWNQQGPKLVGSGAVGNAVLGTSVALSADGNTAIVGGPNDNSGAGAVWVFTRSGGVWSQQGSKLVGTGAVGNAQQGASVSVSGDGNTFILGGSHDNTVTGAAWVFTRSGGVWTQQGSKLVGTGTGANNACQGTSVALSEDSNTAMLGGPGCTPFTGSSVGVWVFTRTGGVWTQQGSQLVNTAIAAAQGYTVALSGDGNTAIMGGATSGELNTGVAGVFVRNGGVWSQQGGALNCTTGQQIGFAGTAPCSVALSADGNTAILGGAGRDLGPGAALVYTRSGGVWTQQAQLIGTGSTSTFQSRSVGVSANGTTVLVGGLDNSGTGAAWIFGPHNAAATHDFNADARSDVLWRDSAGDVGMWLMNGASIASAGVVGNMPNIWSIVGQRDFSGNGDADILWRDSSGNVGIWLMNGSTIASSTMLGNVPTSWSVAGTGDFNNDGMGDIVWRDTSGNVGIWFMNGTTITQTAIVGSMPTSWIIVGADTKGDIFWRNTVSGNVAIWVVNGTAVTQSVDLGAVPPSWTIAGIGDFDGNGSEDILWRDSSGNVGIWLMNGTRIMSTAVLGNVTANWSIAETGDYDGDGKTDILWIDNAGDVGIWFMNGTTIASVTSYGNVGTAWSVQSLNAD